jgi:hypothetical protein
LAGQHHATQGCRKPHFIVLFGLAGKPNRHDSRKPQAALMKLAYVENIVKELTTSRDVWTILMGSGMA